MVTLGASNILTYLQDCAQASLRVSFFDCTFRLIQFHSRWCAWKWISCIALTSNAVTDVLIAGSMCWYLYRQRTGLSRQVCPFVIYAELVDDLTQIWFHTLNIDDLQYQYRFIDEVSALFTLINDPKSNLNSVLGVAVTINVRIFRCNLLTLHIVLFYDQFAISPASLTCVAILWVLSKCTLQQPRAQLEDGKLTSSHSLYKLFACHASSLFDVFIVCSTSDYFCV